MGFGLPLPDVGIAGTGLRFIAAAVVKYALIMRCIDPQKRLLMRYILTCCSCCSPGRIIGLHVVVVVAHGIEDLPVVQVIIGEALAEEQFPEEALQVVIVWPVIEP